jgi:hypothetical protein
MKTILHSLLILLICLGTVSAQDAANVPTVGKFDEFLAAGMEMVGVGAPYYDSDGAKRAQLYCGYAKVLPGGMADVSNLRIDVFQDGVSIMTIFAPQCFTKIEDADGKNILVVYSDGEVLIDMDQMTISGKGFNFSSEENKFEILHDAKVLVKESARGMQGVDL